jgi:hypothetical protein
MSLKLNSSGGGSVTLQEPTTASNVTLNLPAADGTIITTASTFAGTGPAFSATRSAAQTISAATWTKVQFSTEEFDTANCYDPTTNYRFTPNVAGYYLITVIAETNVSSNMGVAVYKNGSTYRRSWASNPGVGAGAVITSLIYMNGSTDYVESYVYQNNTAALYNNTLDYEFSGLLVRAA